MKFYVSTKLAKWQYWHHRLYYIKTKIYPTKNVTPVSIEVRISATWIWFSALWHVLLGKSKICMWSFSIGSKWFKSGLKWSRKTIKDIPGNKCILGSERRTLDRMVQVPGLMATTVNCCCWVFSSSKSSDNNNAIIANFVCLWKTRVGNLESHCLSWANQFHLVSPIINTPWLGNRLLSNIISIYIKNQVVKVSPGGSLPASPPHSLPRPFAPCLAPSLPVLLPCPLAPCLAPSLPVSLPRPLAPCLDLDSERGHNYRSRLRTQPRL